MVDIFKKTTDDSVPITGPGYMFPDNHLMPLAGSPSFADFAENTQKVETNRFRFNDNILQQAIQHTTTRAGEIIRIELHWQDVPILFSAPVVEYIYLHNPNSSAKPGSF